MKQLHCSSKRLAQPGLPRPRSSCIRQPKHLVGKLSLRALPQSSSASLDDHDVGKAHPSGMLRSGAIGSAARSVVPDQDLTGAAELNATTAKAASGLLAAWDSLPGRLKLVAACAGSFVICNMDKVNMSVAIIPMAQDFGWSSSVSGIVQSAFFYGYMLTQLPGGMLTSKFGGRSILPAGVGLWSVATAGVPLLASTIPGLCVSRALVGLGEAVAPSAAIDIVARAVPPAERSRATAFIFSGLHVGSILGLLIAPVVINEFGWEAVFVSFGVLGLVWVAWFENMMGSLKRSDPQLTASLSGVSGASASSSSGTSSAGGAQVLAAQAAAVSSSQSVDVLAAEAMHASSSGSSAADHHGALIDSNMDIPWRAFVRSRAVQALMWTHFTNNWFHYTMLAWLPTYFVDTLSVDLMHASQTALLPPLAGIAASAVAGPLADTLIGRGLPVPLVRKLAQCTAFLVPAALLFAMDNDAISSNSNLTVGFITAALGISSFSLAGLYCTHQDLSPKYAPALLGLTNTAGAIPGIMGVMTVGFLYDYFQSWEVCLFAPSALLMLTGALVYTVFGRNDPVDFDAEDNSPFEWERKLKFWEKHAKDV